MYLLNTGIKLLCDQLFNPKQVYCTITSKWIQCFSKWISDLMYSHGLNVCISPKFTCWNPIPKVMVSGRVKGALMIRISAHKMCLRISDYALLILCMIQPIISKFLYLRCNFKTCHEFHLFSYTNSKYPINSISSCPL